MRRTAILIGAVLMAVLVAAPSEARTYKLTKTVDTHWWRWECKGDPTIWGVEVTKSLARQKAREACNDAYVISPPDFYAETLKGAVKSFKAYDLGGTPVLFTMPAISEDAFYYVFGMDEMQAQNLSDLEKATAILKVWGLYRGGSSVEELKRRHYLNDSDFDQLIRRQVNGLEIFLEDDGSIQWIFPRG